MTEVIISYNTVKHLLNWVVQQALGDMARATSSLFPPSPLEPVPSVSWCDVKNGIQGPGPSLLSSCWEEVHPPCGIWRGKILGPNKKYLKLGSVHWFVTDIQLHLSLCQLCEMVNENVFKIKSFKG